MSVQQFNKQKNKMKIEVHIDQKYMVDITYRPELSNSDYTGHQVFTIKADCADYPLVYKYILVHRVVEAIMNDGSWRHAYYTLKNKKEPSVQNALHIYHDFSYDKDTDEFTYTLVTPYDD